jgi:hypothetical protein
MSDLVAWLRADEPGDPIHSAWRPTRQRFGVLRWGSGAARLDVKVEEESPFVPRFVEQRPPPEGSRRRKAFPADKNELTLAAAWRFVEQQKDVLVYCVLRKSVEALGSLILDCIRHGVLVSLGAPTQRVKDAMAVGAEWLGTEHPAVACLEHGVALHHGGLPRAFLNEVERLLRTGDCRLTIASPTLAQGVNLSASVLFVPSIWRNQEVIPAAEFANVAGRAGRPFADVEGLVLHVVWEKTKGKADYAVRNWESLIGRAKAPRVASGILQLSVNILKRIATKADIKAAEVLEYVTNQDKAWEFDAEKAGQLDVDEQGWNRDIASLDAAVLALLDAQTDDNAVEDELRGVLEGSLFSRELAKQQEKVQELVRAFVAARAQYIWLETTPAQRKGFHSAGIGLSAGKFIDTNLAALVKLLTQAEACITLGDDDGAGKAVVAFADLVFQTAPFQAPKALPARWRDALLAWLVGTPSADVLALCDDEGVDLIQEALAYRLPWAMEAVRVHALAVEHAGADTLTGLAALAVEAGSSKLSVITLVRAGLSSRAAAAAAVEGTNASFTDRDGMREWLNSELVEERSTQKDWPTERSRQAWLQFYEGESKADRSKWKRETQAVRVQWDGGRAPTLGTSVIVEPSVGTYGGVMTPDFQPLGMMLRAELRQPRKNIVRAQVAADGSVEVEFFGPRTMR